MTIAREALARAVALKFLLSRRRSDRILKFVLEEIAGHLRNRERVELRGFGSFRTVEAEGHAYESEDAGRQVAVPPHLRCVFRPSKNLLKKPAKKRNT